LILQQWRAAEMPTGDRPDPRTLLPLKPDVFLILTILADGAHYGYSIMQAAEERTGGQVRIQAGALYRRLKWMLEGGLIAEVEGSGTQTDDEERRRYYRVTPFGKEVANAEARRMADLLAAAEAAALVGSPKPAGGS
jgi:DNA-binding PadR family transcriptional regulator